MKILYWTGAGIGNLIQATTAFKNIVDHGHDLHVYPEDVPMQAWRCVYPFKVDKTHDKDEYGQVATFLSKRPENIDQYDIVLYSEFRGLKNPPVGKNVHRPKMNWWYESEQEYHLRICHDIIRTGLDAERKFHVYPQTDWSPGQIKQIVLAPCGKSAQSIKKWHQFPALSKELLARGYGVAVVGRRDDFNPKSFPGTSLFVNQPLDHIGTILGGSDIVIANDCGLMHYANAIGVPTYGIFGPTSIMKNCPKGVFPVYAKTCSYQPCQEKYNDWQYSTRTRCSHKCLKGLTVDMVLERIGCLK